jgi:hypothetical protein
VFSTIRLRTNKTRGKCGQDTLLALVYKLFKVASKNFHSIYGVEQLKMLCEGVEFVDGLVKGGEK